MLRWPTMRTCRPLALVVALGAGLLLLASDETERRTPADAAFVRRHFVFHAIDKTGTTSLRAVLQAYARAYDIDALTFENCGGNGTWWPPASTVERRLLACHRTCATPTRVLMYAWTMERLRACCEPFVRDRDFVPEALMHHFPLSVPANKAFYEAHMMHYYRFTVVRAPVAHFVSWFAHQRRSLWWWGEASVTWTADDMEHFEPLVREFDEHLADESRSPTTSPSASDGTAAR